MVDTSFHSGFHWTRMHTLRDDRAGNDTLTRAKAWWDSLGKFKAENFESIKDQNKLLSMTSKQFYIFFFCVVWCIFHLHCFDMATGLGAALLGFLTQIREWSPVWRSSSKAPSLSSTWSRAMRELNWALQKLSALKKVSDSLSNWKAQREVMWTSLDCPVESEKNHTK